jgi:hypothetical protein
VPEDWEPLGAPATPGHAIVQSFEPGEDWRYCFVDDVEV